MPKATVNSGVSNAGARAGEPGYAEPASTATGSGMAVLPPPAVTEVVAAPAPEAPAVTPGAEPEPVPAVSGSAPGYASMTVAQLRGEAKARGLPVGGSKADLAARVAGHDAAPGGGV